MTLMEEAILDMRGSWPSPEAISRSCVESLATQKPSDTLDCQKEEEESPSYFVLLMCMPQIG